MKCPNCGKEIADGTKFCKFCGGKIENKPVTPSEPEKIVCKACGAVLTPGVKFCIKCGTPVAGEMPLGQQEPVKQQPPKKQGKKSSGGKTAVIVISIILAVIVVIVGAIFGGKFAIKKIQQNRYEKEMEALYGEDWEEIVNGLEEIIDEDDDRYEDYDKYSVEEEIEEEEEEIEEEIPLNPLEDENAYIIPDSSERYLTISDLEGLTARELNYAKNEIYARNGRLFQSNELQTYFDSKTWYNGRYSADTFDSQHPLTDIERKNADLIRDAEYAIEPKGYPLDQ